MEETTLEALAATTTILPDDAAAAAVAVVSQKDLADEQQTEKVDEVQTAKTRNEEEDLLAEPSQIREVIVDPPEVANHQCIAFFGCSAARKCLFKSLLAAENTSSLPLNCCGFSS